LLPVRALKLKEGVYASQEDPTTDPKYIKELTVLEAAMETDFTANSDNATSLLIAESILL